jgi:hypothetical protein
MINIMCDIEMTPICIFEDCCEILHKHNVQPAYNLDEVKRICGGFNAQIIALDDLITEWACLHWWQYRKLRRANRNISKAVARVTTYSKWCGYMEERLMRQVEIIDRNRASPEILTSLEQFC